jgi:hypothetical protein
MIHLTRVYCAMPHAFVRWPFTADARVQPQFIPCGICGGQNDIEMILYPSILAFRSQYHSTNTS